MVHIPKWEFRDVTQRTCFEWHRWATRHQVIMTHRQFIFSMSSSYIKVCKALETKLFTMLCKVSTSISIICTDGFESFSKLWNFKKAYPLRSSQNFCQSLRRLPWHELKSLLWSVTQKVMMMGNRSLKRLPWRELKSLLWRITKKATMMGDRSLKRLPWRELKSLLWCITEKATLTDDKSLKRLPWCGLKRLLWHVSEKATMTGDISLNRLLWCVFSCTVHSD
jgi:hypothetical protein